MNIWYLLTVLGDPSLWVFLTAAITLAYFPIRMKMSKQERKPFKAFILLLVPSLAITLLLSFMLKESVPMERPCILCPAENCNPYCPPDSKFPSGHAATVFAVFTSLLLVLKKRKYMLLFAIPLLISYSRLALGVHTPVDIFGGAVLGIAVSAVVWMAEKKLYKYV